jgi:hypothetical protein
MEEVGFHENAAAKEDELDRFTPGWGAGSQGMIDSEIPLGPTR